MSAFLTKKNSKQTFRISHIPNPFGWFLLESSVIRLSALLTAKIRIQMCYQLRKTDWLLIGVNKLFSLSVKVLMVPTHAILTSVIPFKVHWSQWVWKGVALLTIAPLHNAYNYVPTHACYFIILEAVICGFSHFKIRALKFLKNHRWQYTCLLAVAWRLWG